MMGRRLGWVLAAAALTADSAWADGRAEELSELARDVAKFSMGSGIKSIAIDRFTAKRITGDSFECGPGLARELERALEQLGMKVDPAANHAVKGEYWRALDEKRDCVVIQFQARVVDTRTNKELIELQGRTMYGAVDVAHALGVNVVFPVGSTPAEKERILRERDDKPAASVRGASVGASDASSFRYELLVKDGKDFVPRKPVMVDGRPNYDLQKKDVYRIKIVNESNYDVAVDVSIDGVDLFAFSDAVRNAKGPIPKAKVIVLKNGECIIPGWPINPRQSDEFLVAEYIHGSARSKEIGDAHIGMIVLQFSPCWEKGKQPPEFKKLTRDKVFTERGARIDTPFNFFEREIGEVMAVVVARYSR